VTIASLGMCISGELLNPDVIHPLLVGLCIFLRLNVVSGKSLCSGKDYPAPVNYWLVKRRAPPADDAA
jgi:hypothetical protein